MKPLPYLVLPMLLRPGVYRPVLFLPRVGGMEQARQAGVIP